MGVPIQKELQKSSVVIAVRTGLLFSFCFSSSSSYVCHGYGHMLTRSRLTYLQVSSEVFHDSFFQLGNSVSLSWVVCREAFCLHVVSSSSCIPVVYLELVLFLIPLQCVNLICNLSLGILLTCCIQFLLYSGSLSRTGVISNSFAICEFVL